MVPFCGGGGESAASVWFGEGGLMREIGGNIIAAYGATGGARMSQGTPPIPSRSVAVDPRGAMNNPVSSPRQVIHPTPEAYLAEAMAQQGLRTPPTKFGQTWTTDGVKYEVRIHPGESAHGKTGNIFRVMRHIPSSDANGQGRGREYLNTNNVWHPERTLKPGSDQKPNPTYNQKAAESTHIDVPNPF